MATPNVGDMTPPDALTFLYAAQSAYEKGDEVSVAAAKAEAVQKGLALVNKEELASVTASEVQNRVAIYPRAGVDAGTLANQLADGMFCDNIYCLLIAKDYLLGDLPQAIDKYMGLQQCEKSKKLLANVSLDDPDAIAKALGVAPADVVGELKAMHELTRDTYGNKANNLVEFYTNLRCSLSPEDRDNILKFPEPEASGATTSLDTPMQDDDTAKKVPPTPIRQPWLQALMSRDDTNKRAPPTHYAPDSPTAFVVANKDSPVFARGDYWEIADMGTAAGFTTYDSFTEYTVAVHNIRGIDMAQLRIEGVASLQSDPARAAAHAQRVSLHVHTDERRQTFAITNRDAGVICARPFSAAELADCKKTKTRLPELVARHAVQIASLISKTTLAPGDVVRLELSTTDSSAKTYAKTSGRKPSPVGLAAKRLNVVLEAETIPARHCLAKPAAITAGSEVTELREGLERLERLFEKKQRDAPGHSR